jgi:hypothetical protein
MGASKDLFMSIILQAEIEEEHWIEMPEKYKEQFKIKRIEADKINGVDAKEVYKKDEQWRKFNTLVGDAMQARSEWEAKIRIANR